MRSVFRLAGAGRIQVPWPFRGKYLRFADKQEFMDHYGDNMMPMKLRISGQEIYGIAVAQAERLDWLI